MKLLTIRSFNLGIITTNDIMNKHIKLFRNLKDGQGVHLEIL